MTEESTTSEEDIVRATKFYVDIQHWFDDTRSHLENSTRRKALENIIDEHILAIKRRVAREKETQKKRERIKDTLLIMSLITAVLSFGPNILEILGVEVTW